MKYIICHTFSLSICHTFSLLIRLEKGMNAREGEDQYSSVKMKGNSPSGQQCSNSWETEAIQMSINGWIDKPSVEVWSICTIEYYSVLERKDILTQATTRMNLKGIMLNESSQSQKDKHCIDLRETAVSNDLNWDLNSLLRNQTWAAWVKTRNPSH